MGVEHVLGVLSLLDAQQPLVVRAVVGASPVFEVWVGEVWKHSPGSPRSYGLPRRREPPSGRILRGRRRVGIDGGGVFEREELTAMDERRGVRADPVVGAAPGGEVQLA